MTPTPPERAPVPEVVIATRNPGKLREFEALLADMAWRCVPVSRFDLPPLEERGATLHDNARHKAIETAARTGLPALADDTGLEVDALGGAPGVHSARWAGEGATAQANNRKLLEALAGLPAARRGARFRTVIVWAQPGPPGERPRVRFEVEGVLEGTIALAPRGDGGFGYDPLFVPRGERRTLAEMRAEEKNAISHRARALAALRQAMRTPGAV